MESKYITRNGSGYADPTVDAVIKKEDELKQKKIENSKYYFMKKELYEIIDKYGYELTKPIYLVNKESGSNRRIY